MVGGATAQAVEMPGGTGDKTSRLELTTEGWIGNNPG